MKKLTLIGGAPMTGKTTLSRKIAKEEGAVELSSDSVVAWMKGILDPKDCPELFYDHGVGADEYYEKFSPEEVVENDKKQGVQAEKGILSLLETAITWDHLIIEGIAITPEFIVKLKGKFKDREVEGTILVDHDKERIEKRIRKRGLWGPLSTYSSDLIPKEVEWVVLYNRWFNEQAEKHNIKINEIGDG